MATLVEQLLFLARGDNNTQAVQFKSFDLSAVVDEGYRETEWLETGRQVGSAIQPGIQFYGDTGLLKQALRILVDNAVKYTPEGGALFVRLQGKDGIVELSVSDTGQGIAPDDLPKVFQRFCLLYTSFSDGKFNFTTQFGGWLTDYMEPRCV